MNISNKTRELIIRQHRGESAKKAAATKLQNDPEHFKKIGAKGGKNGRGKPKIRRR